MGVFSSSREPRKGAPSPNWGCLGTDEPGDHVVSERWLLETVAHISHPVGEGGSGELRAEDGKQGHKEEPCLIFLGPLIARLRGLWAWESPSEGFPLCPTCLLSEPRGLLPRLGRMCSLSLPACRFRFTLHRGGQRQSVPGEPRHTAP